MSAPETGSGRDPEDDETIVRPRAAEEPDETVVMPRRDAEPDETVVVPRRDAELEDTVVAPRRDADRAPEPDETVVAPRLPGPPEDPERTRLSAAPPVSPIRLPDAPRAPETPKIQVPRVYGARQIGETAVGGADAVQQLIGPPPPDREQAVVARPPMPSLSKRFRRARITTLAGYGAATVIAVAGLWIIARIAFG